MFLISHFTIQISRFFHFCRFLDFLANKLSRAKRNLRTIVITALVREKLTFHSKTFKTSKLPKVTKDDEDNVGEYNADNDGEYDGGYEEDNEG